MSLKTIKRLASKVLNVGKSHVKINDAKKASEALTTEDVKSLVSEGVITKEQKTGVGRGKAKFKQARKKLGRRVGPGSARGKKYSIVSRKTRWITKVRGQRKLLTSITPSLVPGARKKLYTMIKGGAFTSKKNMLNYVNENKLTK
ncbi:50S ribosomal protein L19e [Candidatus Micrarchaeota archaeon]|nr:50S ribosomal protein L19e [Candidatus Micrarchaeota archaeon]